MQTMAVFIKVSSSAAQHTLVQVGAPLLAVPLSFAPLALCGELFVSPIPQAIDCLDHARNVAG